MFQGVFSWIEPGSCSKSFNLQVGCGWFAFGPAASMVDRPQRNSWEGFTITPVDEAIICYCIMCLFFCIWDACRLRLDFSINLHGHKNHAFHVAAWKCKNGMIRHWFQCFRAKPYIRIVSLPYFTIYRIPMQIFWVSWQVKGCPWLGSLHAVHCKEQIANLPSFGHSALCLWGDQHFHFGPPRNHLGIAWANCMFTYSKRTMPRRHSSRMEKLTLKDLLTALSGITDSEATPMPLQRRCAVERWQSADEHRWEQQWLIKSQGGTGRAKSVGSI